MSTLHIYEGVAELEVAKLEHGLNDVGVVVGQPVPVAAVTRVFFHGRNYFERMGDPFLTKWLQTEVGPKMLTGAFFVTMGPPNLDMWGPLG